MLATEYSPSPAKKAHQVYQLASAKLNGEACRRTPDLGRLVAHATIIDNIRRWSRSTAGSIDQVLVEPEPVEGSASEERIGEGYDVVGAAAFEFENNIAKEWSGHARSTAMVSEISAHDAEEQKFNPKNRPELKRRLPLPLSWTSTCDNKNQAWSQDRPVIVRERAVEGEAKGWARF
ncbi:hypothetical protein LTR84_011302 [Exophiala bonariae]|uniref:Uncharacterized protein n=1 Tax=Exophiala bonariae TaxID=1690606 RepID=A0AAV9MV53_9EURO|nr:hypothetical protein LTR84_011302 [Exophiala bonariae]